MIRRDALTDLFISLQYSTNLHFSAKICKPLIQCYKYHERGVFCNLFVSQKRIINQKPRLFFHLDFNSILHEILL